MAILCTSEWSFGRDQSLLRELEAILEAHGLVIHDVRSEADLQRTILSVSGDVSDAVRHVLELAEIAMDRIDLRRNASPFPRTGSLDRCWWTSLGGEPSSEIQNAIDAMATAFSIHFRVPVVYDEQSSSNVSDSELAKINEGGLGLLLGRRIVPDVGPLVAKPESGISIFGLRSFQLTFFVDLETTELPAARYLAQSVQELRALGDDRFLGMRCTALPLPSLGRVRLFFESTLPDLVDVDPIVDWLRVELSDLSVKADRPGVWGAIRKTDALGATHLKFDLRQLIQESRHVL